MTAIEEIVYKRVKKPELDCSNVPVILDDATMQERYQKILSRMHAENIDTLIIYADLEHGNNFEYLTGFLPRFEEALLVIHSDRQNFMIMGNENLNKVPSARLKATAVHAPLFSLPNQPMPGDKSFREILEEAAIREGSRVGIVGWKNFTSRQEDNSQLYDVPHFIVEQVKAIVGSSGSVFNAARLFIGNKGARCINNVNEIEHYEYGAALASDAMLKAMDALDVGVSEMHLGSILNAQGQRNSVVTIAAAGKRFVKANIYPTDNRVKEGDPISLTVAYKGGLSSRAGYAVSSVEHLPENVQDYIDAVVKPYYHAYVTWMEAIRPGMTGDELYQLIETVLPKDTYHWSLCPGHLVADEEWMSSPVYDGSDEILESGMLFQIDIIPSVKGYAGTSAESTVLLADEELQKEIQEKSPELWQRIEKRRQYLKEELHINLSPQLLPMCSTVAYLRPLLLNKEMAMAVK